MRKKVKSPHLACVAVLGEPSCSVSGDPSQDGVIISTWNRNQHIELFSLVFTILFISLFGENLKDRKRTGTTCKSYIVINEVMDSSDVAIAICVLFVI